MSDDPTAGYRAGDFVQALEGCREALQTPEAR